MATTTTEKVVRIRFDGSAKGLVTATAEAKALVKGFSDETSKAITNSGDSAGSGFFSKLSSWASKLLDAGANSGNAFISGISSAIQSGGPPQIQAAIAAAILGVIAFTLPALGMLAGGALVLAFGAGIAGLGLVFAAQSDKIKNEFSALKDHIVTTMKQISTPLQSVWDTVARDARSTFDKFSPLLAQSFKDMAPHLSSFVDNIFKGFNNLAPAIKPITDAFNSLLDAIGPDMPGWMKKISDAIIAIANSVKNNPQGFADIIGFFVQLVVFALDVVNGLVHVYNFLTIDIPNAVAVAKQWIVDRWNEIVAFFQGVWVAFTGLGSTLWQGVIDGINNAKQWVIDRWNDITAFFQGIGYIISGVGHWMWQGVVDGVNGAKQWTIDRWNDFVSWISGIGGRIGSATSGMWDGIKESFRNAVNWVISKWNNLSLTIGGGSIMGVSVPSVTLNTPDIPYLAKGGTAKAGQSYLVGERGPELFTPGRTGRVTNAGTTADAMGGGGAQTINLTLDLGAGIQQAVQIQIDSNNRATARALGMGVGASR